MNEKSRLATFNVDPQTWENFKQTCQSNGTNASEVLREFVENYQPNTKAGLSQLQQDLWNAFEKKVQRIEKSIDATIASTIEMQVNAIVDRKIANLSRRVEAMAKHLPPPQIGDKVCYVGSLPTSQELFEGKSLKVEDIRDQNLIVSHSSFNGKNKVILMRDAIAL